MKDPKLSYHLGYFRQFIGKEFYIKSTYLSIDDDIVDAIKYRTAIVCTDINISLSDRHSEVIRIHFQIDESSIEKTILYNFCDFIFEAEVTYAPDPIEISLRERDEFF